MTRYGQSAYKWVALDTAVADADPHRMILMLYDGALEAVRRATTFMQEGRTADKGQMLGKAVRIVEEGLKASLDRSAGGQLAQQLASLYDYISMRLLQANLRNDAAALAEVARLLDELRGAWAQIGRPAPAPASAATPAAAPAAVAAAAPRLDAVAANTVSPTAGARFLDGLVAPPLRRFAVSA
jgi:flagellar secretion chaperone FliS